MFIIPNVLLFCLFYYSASFDISHMLVSQLLSQNKANCSLSAFDKENLIEFSLDLQYYIGPYKIKKVVFLNAVKLELPKTIKIHLVVNVSRIRMYLNQVPGQKAKVPKLVIIEGEKEWKVKRVLNKRKVWGKDKYLVCQRANSKPELSQLLFISIWQRELDRVSVRFSTLLIQLLHGLCTTFPCLSCDLSCDINVMWCCDLLSCGMTLSCTSFCVISPR